MKHPSATVASSLAVVMLLAGGCMRAPEPQYELSASASDLSQELQADIDSILVEHTGTPSDPKLLGDGKFDAEHLRRGAEVYMRRCRQCHGTSGGGNGPAADYMYPRPRDYRRGIFKFTSTPFGSKPLREDLLRTIRRGIVGTSMPSFKLLPNADLEAVTDYVLALTHRGELEEQLVYEADNEDTVDPESVPDYVDSILAQWKEAREKVVEPVTPQPELTAERVAAGRQAFLTRGCSKCHGEDGRGRTAENVGQDAWHFETRAADLTSGMLHGGQQPVDVYRRIYSGINGTPMPTFRDLFAQDPDTIWDLVAYVLHVANARRRATIGETADESPAATEAARHGTFEPRPTTVARLGHSSVP